MHDPERVLDADEFRAASISTVRWATVARGVSEVVTIASAVVLARLIPPAEFGRVAIALGIATTAVSLTWAGLGSPLVQMRSIDSKDIEVATMISILAGLVMTALVLLVAVFAVGPFVGHRVAYLLMLVSPVFILSALGTVPTALLQRRLAFRRLSQIEMASTVVGPGTAITLAAIGLDAEAIIFGTLATAVVGTAATLVSARPVRPRWWRGRARQMSGFGAATGLAMGTWVLFTNIDYAILGARLSPRTVGIYWRAYQLGVEYQGKISSILLKVAFPLYSRAPNFEEMRSLRGKMVRVHTIVLYPFLTTLIAVAPEAIHVLFGSQWQDAVFPTQVLAVAGMATAAAAGTVQLALANGHARAVLQFFLVLLAGYAFVIYFASGYGLHAVVIAATVYQVILLAGQFYFLETRLVGIPLRETWGAVLPALVSSALSLAAAYPIARALEGRQLGDLVVLTVAAGVALVVYGAAVRLFFPSSWNEALRFTRAFARRG
jgi:lipopolysaccharide exporter